MCLGKNIDVGVCLDVAIMPALIWFIVVMSLIALVSNSKVCFISIYSFKEGGGLCTDRLSWSAVL